MRTTGPAWRSYRTVLMDLYLQEIKKILQGLAGLKIVGADVVEVAPAYDTQGE